MKSTYSLGVNNSVDAPAHFALWSSRTSTPLGVIKQTSLPNSRGFSFLELLISLLIFAIGFLGLLSLQHLNFKLTQDTILQSTAMSLADNLVEQLMVNKASDIENDWKKCVEDSLPNAQATLTKHGNYFDVQVQWLESQFSEASKDAQVLTLSFHEH